MCQDKKPQIDSSVKVAGKVRKRTLTQANNYEANRYSKRGRGRRLDRIDKAFAGKVYDMVGVNSCIVDVPCGSGRFYDIFSKAKSLIMVDCDDNMLEAAQERYGQADNVKMLKADIASLPLEDNSADLCFCMRLFHHMDTETIAFNALKELARVSGKYVALSFYNKNCWRYYSRKLRNKKVTGHYFSFSRMRTMGKQAGLEIVKRHPGKNLIEQQCLVLFKKTQDL